MKEKWLAAAEILDAYRVIPRVLVSAASAGYAWYFYDSVQWVRGIYAVTGDIPTAVATYAGGTVSALGMVLTLLINKYFDGGRQWNGS